MVSGKAGYGVSSALCLPLDGAHCPGYIVEACTRNITPRWQRTRSHSSVFLICSHQLLLICSAGDGG